MRKEQIAIIALAVWLSSISIFMLLRQSVDFEIFFILSLNGTICIVYFIGLNFVQPVYLKYFRYFIAVGIVIFAVIVVKKVMEIL